MENYGEETPLLRLLPVLQRLISLTEVHKKFGVTKSQIIIAIILHYRGSLNMTEVAKYLSSSKEQATRTISVLCDHGLLERFEDEENRTHVYVRFTEKGTEHMQRLISELNKEVSEKINSKLSPEDIETLNESILTTIDILNKIQ